MPESIDGTDLEIAREVGAIRSGSFDRVKCWEFTESQLTAFADRIRAQQREAKWQPIETAPKDGTEILIWREDSGVLMGRYCSANDLSTMTDKERDELDETSLFQEDWWGGDADDGGYRLEGSEAPTRWMPLPEPTAIRSTAADAPTGETP